MVVTRHLGAGVFPDVAFFQGRIWCAWQNGSNAFLVALNAETLLDESATITPIGPEAGAFVRLLTWDGRLWMAYRSGGPNYHVILRDVSGTHQEALGIGHGNDPVALGAGYVAWQRTGAPTYDVWLKPLTGSAPERLVRQGRPTGLSRILLNGEVRTVDEDRLVVAGYTRPCWADDLVVAEGPQGGTFCRLNDGRELLLWPGREAFTPRCAAVGDDHFAIPTWSREGVRIALVSRDEFRRPEERPQPERLPEGTEIDLLPFIVGDRSTWPRYGDHYMHQTWDGRNLHFLKFGPLAASSPLCDTWERLVLDGDQFYLREDRSQSGAGIYSFHPGTVFKRRMKVGDWIDASDNVLQRYEKGSCRVVDQHRLSYRMGLVEAWRHFDCGGDLGIRDVVKCSYDPGTSADTIEHYWYARGAGWFRWQEQRQDDPSKTHTTSFNRIGGQALTPTQGCYRALVAWPPVTQQVGMTIIEPTTYPATATGNRVRAVCGPNPGAHWASWVEWIYRRVGDSLWIQQGERRNPQDDADHTFTFPSPGDYEIGLRWSSGQTGRQRIVRVQAEVIDPPPPPPPPERTTMQIQTNDRQHYITVSANGLATATQTSADHATVQLELVRGDDGRFALRANGKVGSAQPDGTFTFDRERGAEWRPDGWEALRAERSPLGGESYITYHGTRLRAVNQGGSDLRHDPRETIDIDETFWPSVSLVVGHGGGGHVGGGAIGYLAPAGQMRMEGWSMADDHGPRPMLSATLMDAETQFDRDRGRLLRNVEYCLQCGVDFVRILSEVDWPGGEANPRKLEQTVETIRFIWSLGMRIQLTIFGSHSALSESESERWTRDLCLAIRDAGLEIALALVEVINEAGGARWSVDRCLRHARIVREFLTVVPLATSAPYQDGAATTTGWEENETGARAYLRFIESPANIATPHFDRGTNGEEGQYRICRQPYIAAILGRPFGNNEGAGPGASAQGHDVMRDPTFQRVHANGTWLQKGAFHCWHTNAGVGLSTDSLLESEPGLPGLSAVRAILPNDIANFSIKNWHWGDNPVQSLRGVRAGNPSAPVRTHGLVSGGRVVIHVLGNDHGAELRARQAMRLTRYSWDGTQYAAVEEFDIHAGRDFFAPPAPDQIYVGRFI